MNLFTWTGLATCALGCLCLYLSSPHQGLCQRAWPAGRARVAGAVLLLLAWGALTQAMQRLTASFLLLAAVMLLLAVLPYLGAWWVLQRGARA